MSPADLVIDYIFFQVCAFPYIPLSSKSPNIDNLLISLEALKSFFTSGLDLVGIFHSVAGMLQEKQYCEYIKDREVLWSGSLLNFV